MYSFKIGDRVLIKWNRAYPEEFQTGTVLAFQGKNKSQIRISVDEKKLDSCTSLSDGEAVFNLKLAVRHGVLNLLEGEKENEKEI